MSKSTMFLLMAAALLVEAGAAPISDADWLKMKKEAIERKRAVIYDNDSEDAGGFPKHLEPTDENFLALRTSYLQKYPVDTVVYNANYGACYQLLTPTRAGEVLVTRTTPEAKTDSIMPQMHARGTDPVKLVLEYAHKHDIEFVVGIRINDTHDAAWRLSDGERLVVERAL